MKKITKLSILAIIALFIVTLTNEVKANYQSIYNQRAYIAEAGSSFIKNIRKMEKDGGVMGLKETLKNDGSLISADESGSNNIDVHMQKNTEYGAMIILSASAEYGKQGEGRDRYVVRDKGSWPTNPKKATTTGNVYGVWMEDMQYWNSVVVGSAETNVDRRYVNIYNDTNTRYNGDALLVWHENDYYQNIASASYIMRGGWNSVFNYRPEFRNHYSRAVAVTGIGF